MSTIAELNDAFRRQGASGVICFPNGLAALPATAKEQIMHRVREFDALSEGNDPYGEHDRNRRHIQRPWRSHRGTRERSQSRDRHPARRRTTTQVSFDTDTPRKHSIINTVTSPTTDLTGSIIRTVTISSAKQLPAPAEEHPNPFTSQPANDNLPLQREAVGLGAWNYVEGTGKT